MLVNHKFLARFLTSFLLIVGCVNAADLKPFIFDQIDADSATQQKEWNYLMKYKIFGAEGIVFGNQKIKIPDTVGWFGTSRGDWESATNGQVLVGGPILIGGDVIFHLGPDTVSTGPMRVTGKVTATGDGYASNKNVFSGYSCIAGSVDTKYQGFIDSTNRYWGASDDTSAAHVYSKCPQGGADSVPQVKTDLYIPVQPIMFADTVNWLPALVANSATVGQEIIEIEVPEGEGMYDLYIEKMSASNEGRFLFKMPEGGRLTRVFLRDGIDLGSAHPKLQIAMKDSLGNYNIIENEDYTGNLLFYTNQGISFASFLQTDTIQGTFITTDTIGIAHHLVLAGQLLARKINIDTDFDGSGFIYVPFDPPVLEFDPEVLKEGAFIENNLNVSVPIKLDTVANTEVAFNYCFDVKDSSLTSKPYAAIEDFNKHADDTTAGYPPFYICGVDTGVVRILASTKVPADGYEVKINVKKDTLKEGQEYLVMKVFNLSGAVMKGNKRYGSFDLPIIDDYNPPKFAKDTLKAIAENPKNNKVIIDTLQGLHGDEICEGCKFSMVGTNNYVTIDELTGVVRVKTPSLFDYETIHFIKVKVRVVDANTMSSDTTIVIPVTDVNENPTLEPQPFTVAENDSVGTLVGTIVWGDLDTAVAFTSNIVSAIDGDTAIFSVDSEGNITTKKVLDFENDPSTYKLVVKVADRKKPSKLYVVDTMTITLLDVNELPIFEDQNFVVDEHQPSGTIVGSIASDDMDDDPTKRINVFTVVGGDSDLFSVDPDGVIKTKKEFDYETERRTYTIDVALTDKDDPSLTVVRTMTIDIRNVNEVPVIITDTVGVKENSEEGTVVDTLKAYDLDLGDTNLVFDLIDDPSGCFAVSPEGVITVKKCKELDYEKHKELYIEVEVKDEHQAISTKIIRVNIHDVPPPTLDITEAKNTDSTWKNPDTIYTNIKEIELYCSLNGEANEHCLDTLLKPGKNIIVKRICDIAGFEGCAADSVTVFFSDAAPIVTVSANPDENKATNIYTIVEKTDPDDENIYVNRTKNEVYVKVKDPASGRDSSFKVTLNLDTLSIPKSTYDNMASVVKSSIALDINPSEGVTRTPVNGTEIKVSYTKKVYGVPVEVSYMTDNDGEIIKRAVVNDKGKVDSIEVITVSYETVINGKVVTISYEADAVTGAKLVKDPSGKLMTETAASKLKTTPASYSVTYDYKDATGNYVVVTYSVDENGTLVKNAEGDIAYKVSYTYVNKFGNSATQSVSIVLDRTLPKVQILSPEKGEVIRSNFVEVKWTVNGVEQDSLTLQGLEKGQNTIVRFYRDKAGNEAYDSVTVFMKDGKDVDISVEQPVTVVTRDMVEEYYAENKPKDGQTFAVSILNPETGKEVETLIGGTFETTSGSGEEPYPNVEGPSHLGPTLVMDVKVPVVSGVSGLATLDDLISSDGRISSAGVDVDEEAAKEAGLEYQKYTVEEYVANFCEEDVVVGSDYSRVNLYDSELKVQIWVYTTLGNFVGYQSFTQELNNPDYANKVGMLQLFYEMKPDKDGYVRAENEKMLATGAYLYKVDATIKNHLRCSIPPFDGASPKKKGDMTKSNDNLLKGFGYKRPEK